MKGRVRWRNRREPCIELTLDIANSSSDVLDAKLRLKN